MQSVKKRGRKPTTGRFDTREALEAFIWREYTATPRKVSQIARAAKVSETVVHRVLAEPRSRH